MTCNELHDHVESSPLRFLTEGGLSADVAAHIEHCSACRQWIEIEEQLSNQLHLLRDNAPVIPATLDESILKGYRAQFQAVSSFSTATKPMRPMSTLVWRAAIAAVLLVGAIILFGNRKAPSPQATAKVQPMPNGASAQPENQAKSETPKTIADVKVVTPRVHHRTTIKKTENTSAEATTNPLPPDFRNLMYCDQISCSGAMEVIRMNLPASALGMSSPSRTSNVVAADVVVGPDGVARAIRILN